MHAYSYGGPMLASITTFAVDGIDSRRVIVEVDVPGRGLAAFTIVGLPDRAVRESRERVRAALKNSGFGFPDGRITVNLAPADVRKAGPVFDLAIAVGILSASGQIAPEATAGYGLCGELSLAGTLRPIRGALAVALGAKRAGTARLLMPPECAAEAALVDAVEAIPVPGLEQIVALFRGDWEAAPAEPAAPHDDRGSSWALDLADVRARLVLPDAAIDCCTREIVGWRSRSAVAPKGDRRHRGGGRRPAHRPGPADARQRQRHRLHQLRVPRPPGRARHHRSPRRLPRARGPRPSPSRGSASSSSAASGATNSRRSTKRARS
jgi:hypothetical protein